MKYMQPRGGAVLPLHTLGKLSNATVTVTKDGTAVKNVQCEACNFEYVYQVSRQSQGRSTGFLVPDEVDYETAERRASDKLHKLLKQACDPVPCPACGRCQRDMVRRARQLRYRPLLIAGLVLFFISCILLMFLVIGALADAPPARQAAARSTWFTFLLLWGATLAPAAVLLVLRYVLARSFEPNAEDVEGRIRQGRSRAVSKEAYLTGVLPPAPMLPPLLLHEFPPRFREGERITLPVRIELRGAAPGVAGGGVLDQPMHTIEVECPRYHVPESILVPILVNIGQLQVGSAVHVRELTLPADVKALADPDAVVVHVTQPRVEAEAAPAPAEAAASAEPEIVGRRIAAEEEEKG
jgi:hypothetical protein